MTGPVSRPCRTASLATSPGHPITVIGWATVTGAVEPQAAGKVGHVLTLGEQRETVHGTEHALHQRITGIDGSGVGPERIRPAG